MTVIRNYSLKKEGGKTEIKISPYPQFIEGLEGGVELAVEYAEVIEADPLALDEEGQEKLQQYQQLKSHFYIPRAGGRVILDAEVENMSVDVLGRSPAITSAEKMAGIEYPRELVWVEGAENTPGVIEFNTTYDRYYIIKGSRDNPEIRFINSFEKEQRLQGKEDPERPYYKEYEGRSEIYVNGFSGGSGTQNDPYIIETLQELQDIDNDLSAYYELGGDIDASETFNWNNGEGFIPIGNNGNEFTGSLDGKGYTIDGLFFSRSNDDYQGLFGAINGATIKNINITNVEITANTRSGILSGGNINNPSTIENCHTQGNITGYERISCFVGQIFDGSTINDCSATGNLTILGSYTSDKDIYVAGFVGLSYSSDPSYDRCFTEVNITSDGDNLKYIGGFVGYTYNNEYFNECYAGGSINTSGRGLIKSGGFVGYSKLTYFINCYSKLSFDQNDNYIDCGGFVGNIPDSTVIENCYSACTIPNSNGSLRAFVGHYGTLNSEITNTYFDSELSEKGDVWNSNTTGLTTIEMKDPSNFTGWDFLTVWETDLNNVNDGYHILQNINYDPGGAEITAQGQLVTSVSEPFNPISFGAVTCQANILSMMSNELNSICEASGLSVDVYGLVFSAQHKMFTGDVGSLSGARGEKKTISGYINPPDILAGVLATGNFNNNKAKLFSSKTDSLADCKAEVIPVQVTIKSAPVLGVKNVIGELISIESTIKSTVDFSEVESRAPPFAVDNKIGQSSVKTESEVFSDRVLTGRQISPSQPLGVTYITLPVTTAKTAVLVSNTPEKLKSCITKGQAQILIPHALASSSPAAQNIQTASRGRASAVKCLSGSTSSLLHDKGESSVAECLSAVGCFSPKIHVSPSMNISQSAPIYSGYCRGTITSLDCRPLPSRTGEGFLVWGDILSSSSYIKDSLSHSITGSKAGRVTGKFNNLPALNNSTGRAKSLLTKKNIFVIETYCRTYANENSAVILVISDKLPSRVGIVLDCFGEILRSGSVGLESGVLLNVSGCRFCQVGLNSARPAWSKNSVQVGCVSNEAVIIIE